MPPKERRPRNRLRNRLIARAVTETGASTEVVAKAVDRVLRERVDSNTTRCSIGCDPRNSSNC